MALFIARIIFSGRYGGLARINFGYCIIAAGKMTSTIQEIHIVLARALYESVPRALFGE